MLPANVNEFVMPIRTPPWPSIQDKRAAIRVCIQFPLSYHRTYVGKPVLNATDSAQEISPVNKTHPPACVQSSLAEGVE